MRRLLRREDGIALVMALGIMLVITISTVATISYTSAGSRNSRVSSAQLSALALAESGISTASSIINTATNAAVPTLLGCTANGNNSTTPCTDRTLTAPSGTASFHGLYTAGAAGAGTWVITSTGDIRNPTGASDTRKTMTATIAITPGGQVNNISLWNYVYSTAPQDPNNPCEVTISGTNVVVDVPIYVTGDLCMTGTNSAIVENTASGGQPVDVHVGGTVSLTGTHASVGTTLKYLTSGLAEGGCKTTANPTAHGCTTADGWYVTKPDSPVTATAPTTDFPSRYLDASPGPSHTCTSALTPSPNLMTSTPKAFDNNPPTMDGTNTSFELTPTSTSYNCVTSSGTLNWDKTKQLLTVSGTIFFDGNVTISNSGAMYLGKATIYVNGTLSLSGNVNASFHAACPATPPTGTYHQCAFSDVKKEWDPNTTMIIFVSNKANGTAVDLSGTKNDFQGGIECSSTSTVDLTGTDTKVEGPIICGKLTWFTNTRLLPLPAIAITNVPNGAPNWPATIGPPTITGS